MTGPRNDLDQFSDTGETRCDRTATYLIIPGDSRRIALAVELPQELGQGLSKGVPRNDRVEPETCLGPILSSGLSMRPDVYHGCCIASLKLLRLSSRTQVFRTCARRIESMPPKEANSFLSDFWAPERSVTRVMLTQHCMPREQILQPERAKRHTNCDFSGDDTRLPLSPDGRTGMSFLYYCHVR
jgi:hypothetical protein